MASPSPLSEANVKFFLALFKELNDKDKKANVFFSPFSISSALAMVTLGARNNTAKQMSEVLCFPGAEQPDQTGEQQLEEEQQEQQEQPEQQSQSLEPMNDDVHVYFEQLLKELKEQDVNKYALNIANRLYGEKSFQFVQEFLTKTRENYGAELESVDFKNDADGVRLGINKWVEKETRDKIKDLLPEGTLNDLTRLVLVNAIYFKGKWLEKFKESDTTDAEFRINKNDGKPVKMMHQSSKFHYTSNPETGTQILEMPYVGEELSMFIILPKDIDDDTTGLEKLESELTYQNFEKWTGLGKDKTQVKVSLPRFKMEKMYELNKVLIRMGMVDAFDNDKSDFSGISPAADLAISNVAHKGFVEVNEEGTEAAAATGISFGVTSAPITLTFNADHPFLFFIQHKPTMTILFAGRFCSPE